MENQNKLYRSSTTKMIGGVAGGLSEYFQVDVVVFRLLFVLLLLFSGGGLLAYIVLWIVIPQHPLYFNANHTEEKADTPSHTKGVYANQNKTSRSLIGGVILIFLGLLFLFDNLTPWYNLRDFWPLVLIFAGAVVMFPHILKPKHLITNSNTENHEK